MYFLEDDFQPDEPAQVDAETASLDLIADSSLFDEHLPEPDVCYLSAVARMEQAREVRTRLVGDIDALLQVAREAAGVKL